MAWQLPLPSSDPAGVIDLDNSVGAVSPSHPAPEVPRPVGAVMLPLGENAVAAQRLEAAGSSAETVAQYWARLDELVGAENEAAKQHVYNVTTARVLPDTQAQTDLRDLPKCRQERPKGAA